MNCNNAKYEPKLYKGNLKITFKKRYAYHGKSFNVKKYSSTQQLSIENSNIANKQLQPHMSRRIKLK